jgi:hypothetical protein
LKIKVAHANTVFKPPGEGEEPRMTQIRTDEERPPDIRGQDA